MREGKGGKDVQTSFLNPKYLAAQRNIHNTFTFKSNPTFIVFFFFCKSISNIYTLFEVVIAKRYELRRNTSRIIVSRNRARRIR